MPECIGCHEDLPATGFYASRAAKSGLQSRCRPCYDRKVKAWREANDDSYRAKKSATKRLHRKEALARVKARGLPVQNNRLWRQLNPLKNHAHHTLQRAVRSGKTIRPLLCSSCGEGGRINGHHDDYTKPLEVRWLCQLCHKLVHPGNPQPRGMTAKQGAVMRRLTILAKLDAPDRSG